VEIYFLLLPPCEAAGAGLKWFIIKYLSGEASSQRTAVERDPIRVVYIAARPGKVSQVPVYQAGDVWTRIQGSTPEHMGGREDAYKET
jgi:hypothetical protein